MNQEKLKQLREKFSAENESIIYDEHFSAVAKSTINSAGTRVASFAGISTLLDAGYKEIQWDNPQFDNLEVGLLGIPMDLAISNRNGCRFGPRGIRTIERVGPYNHALKIAPLGEIKVADIGDVPFRSRYNLVECHEDIEKTINIMLRHHIIPLSVGGDHSITLPILRAIGKNKPVAMIHIDAHCDTGGPFDGNRFHHGGPFRQAVLDGVLDPEKTIQIGIRGSSEYLWEFSYESGMQVIHAETLQEQGVDWVLEQIKKLIQDHEVYVSFDIDSLDPAFAPGTGTPEIGGLTTAEALALLRGLQGMNIVGADVVEVSPQYDATTNTVQAGAQMLFELLSLIAINKKNQ